MGIGLNTGRVIVGNIGSEERMKYGMVGDDVNLAARVESFTVDGEILISRATRDALGERARVRGPLEAQAKGKKEPLVMFAVVSVGPPHDLLVPAEHRAEPEMVETRLRADVFRIEGKHVAADAIPATVLRLGSDDLELETDMAGAGSTLALFDSLKLSLHPPSGADKAPIEDIYAKVVRVIETGYRLRMTSIPEAGRPRLGTWIGST
jgi:adenylate cyclase